MSALTDLFTNIANAIRAKTGSQETIQASDFPTEIANIPSGGVFKPTHIRFTGAQTSSGGVTSGAELQNMLDDTSLSFSELLSCNALFASITENANIQLDLSRHIFPKSVSAASMFYNSKFNSIVFNSNAFKSGALLGMNDMFRGMTNLTSIDLSCIDFSNVSGIGGMFNSCTNLTSINFGNADLSGVTQVNGCFYQCTKGTQKMVSDFISCLTGNTSITSFYELFLQYGFSNNELTNLDITGIPSSNVTNMSNMFAYYALNTVEKQLTIGELDCGKVNTINDIFKSCNRLVKINGKFKDLGKAYSNTTVHYSVYRLDLSPTAINHDSLVNIIDGLYDLNTTYASQGKSLARQELKLGSTLSAKLSAAEIQVATDKGWDVT